MQKKAIRGAPLPHQVHYYSNVGDRLPVLGDEERETRQTFQELVQLAHTCNVLLRRAIWSVDPTVFNPQYNLQVRLPLTRLTNQPSIQRPCLFRTRPLLPGCVHRCVHTHTACGGAPRTTPRNFGGSRSHQLAR